MLLGQTSGARTFEVKNIPAAGAPNPKPDVVAIVVNDIVCGWGVRKWDEDRGKGGMSKIGHGQRGDPKRVNKGSVHTL